MDDDEISIDFGKIKDFFKKKKEHKTEKIHTGHKEDKDEDISMDLGKIKGFLVKHKVVFLILIPLFLSVFLRVQPAYLPITDRWADSTIINYFQSQVSAQIEQQYPNLPAENKNALINSELQKIVAEQKDMIKAETERISQQYKERLQDESGQTYLLAIDPYFWLLHAQNIIEKGHPGDVLKNGTSWDMHMYAPKGRRATPDQFHAYLEAYLYKFLRIFSPELKLKNVAFYVPVLLSALCVIPIFFITRKVGGNFGGFVAAVIVGVHAGFITRTAAGFSDTDAYNVLFPLLITWAVLEAFESKTLTKTISLSVVGAFFVGLYSFAWTGWWYVFDFILGMIVLYLIFRLIKEKKKFFTMPMVKNSFIIFGVFLLFSAIFVSSIMGFYSFQKAFAGPMLFVEMKAVATTTVWPNVYTTVAEQNPSSFNKVISDIGGKFLFFISILGIILTMMKKDENGKVDIKYAIFLTLWFIGTIYASVKGVRYLLLFVPAFSIAIGVALGVSYEFLRKWLVKELHLQKSLVNVVVALLLLILIVQPIRAGYNTAINEVPSMNDAWYESLTLIKTNSSEDAIINSWWDFGHWFKQVGDRAVTFDGTSQNTPMAHWIGHSLLTNDEQKAMGILRMLDCGSNDAFVALDKVINNTPKSVDILHEIFVSSREETVEILQKYNVPEEDIDKIIKLTHCEPPENYYITSDDMIGKAGVWAHFGSWDFHRASMYMTVKKMKAEQGVQALMDKFNLSEEAAENYYYEIQNTDANNWISPWPRYLSGLASCKTEDNTAKCGNGVQVDLSTYEAKINVQGQWKSLQSLTYATMDQIKTKQFIKDTIPYSAALIPTTNGYQSILMDPQLADSVFTKLYFFQGHGMKYFDLFSYRQSVTGNKIWVWKVDWYGKDENMMDLYKVPEQVRASHILICYNGSRECNNTRTKEDAETLAQELIDRLNDTDFEDLVSYSDDPVSKLRDGDLGYFPRGVMKKEFEDAAFGIEPGEVKLIESVFGYHIIKLTDKKSSEELTREKIERFRNETRPVDNNTST